MKSNMVTAIELHIEWIANCLTYIAERGIGMIEPQADAEEKWVRHVNEVADGTLFPKADSGTWAPTSRASRGSSCPISAAFGLHQSLQRNRSRWLSRL